MSARQPVESLSERAAFLAERHNRVLLNALQSGANVQHGSLLRPIQLLIYQVSGGDIETSVRLADHAPLIDGKQIEHQPVAWDAREEERPARVLLHALQTAHRVTVEGRYRFIHTLRFERAGSEIVTTTYLTGSSEPVDSRLIKVLTEQSFTQHPAVAGKHSPRGAT